MRDRDRVRQRLEMEPVRKLSKPPTMPHLPNLVLKQHHQLGINDSNTGTCEDIRIPTTMGDRAPGWDSSPPH